MSSSSSWKPPKSNATLEITNEHSFFRTARWIYWSGSILMSALFLLKMASMMMSSYQDGSIMYHETKDAMEVCKDITIESSRVMYEFCEKVKRGERSPLDYAVDQTANRLYWGFMMTLQALLSSMYTIVVVALVSAFLGYYISSRGLFNNVTPRWVQCKQLPNECITPLEQRLNSVALLKEE